MKDCLNSAYLVCGNVCDDNFCDLKYRDKPINLAYVNVDINKIKYPHILINYSQNLEFEFGGVNPKISITYRLIRKSNDRDCATILEEWTYKVSEEIPTQVENLNTVEPLVLNYCDYLGCTRYESFTYIVQIVDIITDNTSFNITNEEISAIVSKGECVFY